MKHLKLFESFEIVDPIKYGEPLNNKEINFLKGYNIIYPEWVLKDDNYYYVFDHRCENIKDVAATYIHGVCKEFNIKNYTINDDYSIDVNGFVSISYKSLTKIPLVFNKVSENFTCGYNKLTTLEGCPKEVDRFDCSDNQLTTLEGCPKEVGGYFRCSHNQLTTLEGCPKKVGDFFNCSNNQLTTLEGCPKEVGDDFNCQNNQLITLEGSPKRVGGSFYCRDNKLITLEGSPKKVSRHFDCRDNKLITLEGGPKHVGKHFFCSENPLKSREYKGIIKGELIYIR